VKFYLRSEIITVRERNNMKTTITFDLPEDQGDMLQAVHARDAWMALWALDSHLRGRVKHEGCEVSEQIRARLHEELGGISLDDMVE
jgi:hypothetical protein